MTDATIEVETLLQPDVTRLLAASDRRSAALYPGHDRRGPTPEALAVQGACFCVARLAGQAVGCGGFVAEGPAEAELKRIFVMEQARGAGIGRSILATLEHLARQRGIATMRLETGVKSTEAIGLYKRFGYVERAPFGSYGPDPLSLFMEKTL